MQQSFVLIILHISICIHSQLHLWILAGLEADKDSCCIPAFEQTFRILFVFLFCYYRTSHQLDLSISLPLLVLLWGDLCILLLPVLYTPHSFRNKCRICFLQVLSCIHLSRLFRHAFPLTASRVLLNILQSIEAVSIPVFLQYSGMSSSLSLQVYGVLTGMALPCILFPSAITNAVSSMLLPTVAEIQEMKEKRRLQAIISKIACSCIFLDVSVVFFLLISGKWIESFCSKVRLRVVLFSRFPGFVRFYTLTRFFLA